MEFKKKISKKNYQRVKWSRIIICSALVGISVGLIALMFKSLVEQYEHLLFNKAKNFKLFFIIFPFIGLILIYFLRKYIFKNKKNKGISEVLEAVRSKKTIPSYKIPSHFFNGFLTVVFGGTTGIEVSTVVASAALGELASKKDNIFKKYRKEFMGAAIASGVTILFCSPFAGLFFSYETIGKQKTKVFWVTHIFSVFFATIILLLMDSQPLMNLKDNVREWHFKAIPFFLLLSVLAGVYGVYMTKMVSFVKKQTFLDNYVILQLLLGATLLGCVLFIFPQLYGDGYHTLFQLIEKQNQIISFAILILVIVLIKPFTTGLTLKLGGDGGVFAPSIFAGACLGLIIGVLAKNYLMPDLMIVNFVILGVAFTVSATLHAPFTAVFLTFGIFNSYVLWLPLIVLTFISYFLSKRIYPYTVYTQVLNR